MLSQQANSQTNSLQHILMLFSSLLVRTSKNLFAFKKKEKTFLFLRGWKIIFFPRISIRNISEEILFRKKFVTFTKFVSLTKFVSRNTFWKLRKKAWCWFVVKKKRILVPFQDAYCLNSPSTFAKAVPALAEYFMGFFALLDFTHRTTDHKHLFLGNR